MAESSRHSSGPTTSRPPRGRTRRPSSPPTNVGIRCWKQSTTEFFLAVMSIEQKLKSICHHSVSVSLLAPDLLQVRDGRTGFIFDIEFGAVDVTSETEIPDEILSFLKKVGCVGDLPIEQVQDRQRPIVTNLRDSQTLERISEVYEHAKAFVPFYSIGDAYWRNEITSLDEIVELPIINKDILKREFLNLISSNIDTSTLLSDGALRFARTSGSTSDRVQVLTDLRIDRMPPDYESVWDVAFVDGHPRTSVLTSPLCGSNDCNIGRKKRSDRMIGDHTLYLESTFDISRIDRDFIDYTFSEISEFRSSIIFGNPYYLHILADKAQELGLAVPSVDIILTSFQFMPECQRRLLEKRYRCPVRNIYSATELGGCNVGFECSEGNWHLNESQCYVEFVDPRTREVSKNVGSIVVTTLANRVSPLMRYETGDMGCIEGEIHCGCAASNWRCFTFHGRSIEAIPTETGFVTPRAIDNAVDPFIREGAYQLACSKKDNSIRLDVLVESEENFVPLALVDALRELLFDHDISIRRVEALTFARSYKTPMVYAE